MASVWEQATVVVTGGTGSLGRAFLRYALDELRVRAVRIFSRDELKQAEMAGGLFPEDLPRVRFLLGDVRDRARLTRAFAGADVVVHAAALKRVDALAYDPAESIRTNVLGAMNVVEAAIDADVARVVGVSTDKGAAPTNLYGGTKLLMEHLFAFAGAYVGRGRTRFACVRYGNVLGSRGSVLHAWRAQAERGEPLKVAPGVTRFWLTLPRACWAVRVAGELPPAQAGAVYVPTIPRSFLSTLAEAAFPGRMHAAVPLRVGGEKAHETLITGWERRSALRVDGGWLLRHGAAPADPEELRPVTSADGPRLDVAGARLLLREAGWTPAVSGGAGLGESEPVRADHAAHDDALHPSEVA